MSILDQLLGSGNDSANQSTNSQDSNNVIGTDPMFGLDTGSILHSQSSDSGFGGNDESSFVGIDGISLGFAAPTIVGLSNSSDSTDTSVTDSNGGGGLLGGLL